VGYTLFPWRRVDSKGISLKELCSKIKEQATPLWRYGIGGDLPGINNEIDFDSVIELVKANRGKRGFAYTHKPVLPEQANTDIIAENRATIKMANKNGFTINLSANNLEHYDKLKALNIAPVVTILPENANNVTFTPAGNKIIKCPATYKDITCADCQLCSKQRSVGVGFPVHGVQKKRAEKAFQTFK